MESQVMTSTMRPEITSFTLAQCTFNQPTAAIKAYDQFLRQNATRAAAPGTANLIVIDSSPEVSAATAFYERIAAKDDRVIYLHIPIRPGYGDERKLDAASFMFPRAYSWREGGQFHDIYTSSMPSDEQMRDMYVEQGDLRAILESDGPKAYLEILGLGQRLGYWDGMAAVTKDLWTRCVDAVFSREGDFYPKISRPHLSSKRLIDIKIATQKHSDMVCHLDDDWIGENWVVKHREALADADVTGLTHYPVMIQTASMDAPKWAIANLNQTGEGFSYGFDGTSQPAILKPTPMQGWSLAYRNNGALPQGLQINTLPPILYGEDRHYLKWAKQAGFRIAPQTAYDKAMGIRGVIGHSNSQNFVSEKLKGEDDRLPSIEDRLAAIAYYQEISKDFLPPSQPKALPAPIFAGGSPAFA